MCHKENDNLRCHVRRYHTKLDDMCHREIDDHHDHCKRCHTSMEMTPSSASGYVWSREVPSAITKVRGVLLAQLAASAVNNDIKIVVEIPCEGFGQGSVLGLR
jgi:hypothetical protein